MDGSRSSGVPELREAGVETLAVPTEFGPAGGFATFAAVALALSVVALLAIFVDRDPTFGVTSSASPFADEGFNALNARNFVLLGRWSTDGWNLHLVNLPFSLTMAGVFEVFGVGIIQARLATIAMVGASVALLAVGLRRAFGAWPSVLAAAAYGTSALVLYYGRLVYLEDLVSAFVVVALVALAGQRGAPIRWGLVAGLALALAIGTKPSVTFAAIGMLVALSALAARRDRDLRPWLGAAFATVALAAMAWVVLVGIPLRGQVADDLRIWAPITWPTTVTELVHRVGEYVVANDRAAYYSAPLIAAAVIGLVAVVLGRHRLTPDQRVLVVGAIGLVVGGTAILAIASYRPSRYVVPLLPGLAVLAAAGFSLASGHFGSRMSRTRLTGLALVASVALCGPGIAAHLSWMGRTRSTLPEIQREMTQLLPPGATVVGPDAPTMAMRAPVVAIVPVVGVSRNSGDVYATAGARWYLTNPGARPSLVELPAGAWESRREAGCVSWFRATVCLYEVP